MPYLNDEALDGGLDWVIANGTQLDICYTQEPTTYAEATSTYTCGNKTVTCGATENADTGTGRQTTVPAITDGAVTATQTAGWWALTNGTDTLVATNALSATQAVTSGNTFTLDEILIILRDGVSI
jgi:hypothetical protein